MNRVVLIGRLTRDPELRYSREGTAVCGFVIAVNRRNDQADFVRVVCFGKTAENCVNYLHKGALTALQGRLQIDGYTDREGVKRKDVKVVAEMVEFLEGSAGREQCEPRDEWDGLGQDIRMPEQEYGDEVPF